MLLFISDLHLSDSTLAPTTQPGSFRAFAQLLRQAAARETEPECHVVLLGDIFDLLRTTYWHRGPARPWDWGNGAEAEERLLQTVHAITRRIIAANSASLAVLRELAEIDRPRVHLHYMLGNHDWLLAIPAAAPARADIVEALRLDHDPAQPFPWQPDARLEALFAEYNVVASHGDHLDPFNRCCDPPGRLGSSVGDALVIELVAGFIHGAAPICAANPSLFAALREIDNVRPVATIPAWMAATLKARATRSEARALRRLWKRCVAAFNRAPVVRRADNLHPFQPIDFLQRALAFTCVRFHPAWYGHFNSAAKLIASEDRAFESAARQLTREFPGRHVVFGHTHHHRAAVPLGRGSMYFNTGTWRRAWTRTPEDNYALSQELSLTWFRRPKSGTFNSHPMSQVNHE